MTVRPFVRPSHFWNASGFSITAPAQPSATGLPCIRPCFPLPEQWTRLYSELGRFVWMVGQLGGNKAILYGIRMIDWTFSPLMHIICICEPNSCPCLKRVWFWYNHVMLQYHSNIFFCHSLSGIRVNEKKVNDSKVNIFFVTSQTFYAHF